MDKRNIRCIFLPISATGKKCNITDFAFLKVSGSKSNNLGSQKCFLLYMKEIYAQFVETNVLVKHNINIYKKLKPTITDLD